MNDKLFQFFRSCGYLGIFFSLALSLSTCSSSKIIPAYIPKGAEWVIGFDLMNLGSITGSAQPLVEGFHNLLPADLLSPTVKDYFDRVIFEEIAIDSPAFLYFLNPREGADVHSTSFQVFSFMIQDSASFRAAVLKVDTQAEIIEQSNFQYVDVGQGFIAWGQDRGMYITGGEQKEVRTKLAELFNLSDEERLEIQDENLQALLQSNFDMALWVDKDPITTAIQYLDPKWSQDLPDIRAIYQQVAAQINFENGQVDIESKYVLNPKYVEAYGMPASVTLRESFMEKIDVEAPLIFIGCALGEWGIKTSLKELQWFDRTQNIMKFFGMHKDQLYEILSGNVAFILDDIDLEYGFNPTADFIFALEILDREALKDFLEKVGNFPFFQEKKGYYWFNNGDTDYFLIEKEGILLITKSYAMKEKLVKAPKSLNKKILEQSDDQQVLIYIDFEKIIHLPVFETITDPTIQKFHREVLGAFDTFELVAEPSDGIVAESHSEIRLKDDGQNALLIILEMLKNMRQEGQAKS